MHKSREEVPFLPKRDRYELCLNLFQIFSNAYPPGFYFVLNNTKYQLDFTQKNIQDKICGGQGCNPDSLQSQIKLWSKKPNITYIGSPAQSWIDDYFGWSKDCCNVNDGEFCPSNKETGKN